MKNDVNEYNPYLCLDLNNSFYETEVIDYYNLYNELHSNKLFKYKVIKTNNDEVERLIKEFIAKDGNIIELVSELKEKIRKVKNIILITEDARITKKHTRKIDDMIDRAINYKNKKLKTKETYLDKFHVYLKNFLISNRRYSELVIEFKNDVRNLLIECEKACSVDMYNKIAKKINNLTNKVIHEKADKNGVYKYDEMKFNMLIARYDKKIFKNEESFIIWVTNLKKEYKEFKENIISYYSSNKVKNIIKRYDKVLNNLIESKMFEELYLSDNQKLNQLFEDYHKSILNIDVELQNYEYYNYMTEEEKFNIKRELYEKKNRLFKRSIRDFNKSLREKYSDRYASSSVKKISIKADNLIKLYARDVEMPIPKNPWIVRKYLWADTENFVSGFGIKMRKMINTPLKKVVGLAMKNKLVVEEMPKIDKNKQYVFVSTHYFTEDVIGLFSAIDRQAHMLMGTTDQIENNPLMVAAMLFGFFHVDRMDSVDRKECFEKQNILIEKGTSFINYIGGSWETSENELQPLSFSGAYRTSKMKNVLIVPVASYLVSEDKKIYMRFGEPLDVRNYDEKEANEIIRDTLASMHYKQMSKYSYPIESIELSINGQVVKTHNLPYNQHVYHMNKVGDEYWNQPWTKPFAKEEIGVRKSKLANEEDVYNFISNLSREKLIELSSYLSEVMVKISEKERYDIIKYLDSNYTKFKVRGLRKK